MSAELSAGLAAFVAYLVGSLPFGLLTARVVAGVDIRQRGSGNIGATNVGRILGLRWGLFVLLLDGAKGVVSTYAVPRLFFEAGHPSFLHVQVLCGILAVVGHMFPPWLLFRGGKGVATALGVVLVVAPWASLTAIAVFVTTVALTRIMSLGSILGAVAFAAWRFANFAARDADPFSAGEWSLSVFSLLVPALILVRHRSNIGRMLRWEEPKFRFRGKPSLESTPASPEPANPEPTAPAPAAKPGSIPSPSANGNGSANGGAANGSSANGRAGENGSAGKRHADVAPPRIERNETSPPRQPADRA